MSDADATKDPPSPSAFLAGPSPPNCTNSLIDFSTSPLPEYSHHFALQIKELLTPSECDQLLNLARSTTSPPNTWSQAEINIGNGAQRLYLDARNCGRIIWDDFDVAEKLVQRILPHLPKNIVTLKDNALITGNGPAKRGETYKISRLNERLRFLKYEKSMYFREHCDGVYVTPDGTERSYLTIHLYLNGETEPENQRLVGGATRFFGLRSGKVMDINPEAGACLVFQQRGLLHSGEDVEQGIKYTMRTDVMYELVGADGKGKVSGR